VGPIAEWFVGGSAAAAKGNFLSRFDLLAGGIQQSKLPGNQIWSLWQNLNGRI
jgi:hypothetical protein